MQCFLLWELDQNSNMCALEFFLKVTVALILTHLPKYKRNGLLNNFYNYADIKQYFISLSL